MSDVHTRGAFTEAVRKEAAATWSGRYRWLWWALALLLTLAGALLVLGYYVALPGGSSRGPTALGYEVAFWGLCALTCWGSAWLCADLLAWGRRGEPLQPPAPRVVLARALGRLLPFYLFLTLAVGLLTFGFLVRHPLGHPVEFLFGASPDSWLGLPGLWCTWTLAFVTSGLPYAAMAACMSGLSRRPRPAVVTAFVVLFGSPLLAVPALRLAEVAGQGAWGAYVNPLPLQNNLHWLIGVPNFSLGLSGSLLVSRLLGWSGMAILDDVGYASYCWAATLFFLLTALAGTLVARSLAVRRYRQSGAIPGPGPLSPSSPTAEPAGGV